MSVVRDACAEERQQVLEQLRLSLPRGMRRAQLEVALPVINKFMLGLALETLRRHGNVTNKGGWWRFKRAATI